MDNDRMPPGVTRYKTGKRRGRFRRETKCTLCGKVGHDLRSKLCPAREPTRPNSVPKNLEQRFRRRVEERADGCHVWTGQKLGPRYGFVRIEGMRISVRAVAFFLAHGRWPAENSQVRLTCSEPLCVNPAHFHVPERESKRRARVRDKVPSLQEPSEPATVEDFLEFQSERMLRYASGA